MLSDLETNQGKTMKINRQRRKFVLLVLAIVAAGLGYWLLIQRHHIDHAHYLLLSDGMTEAEVEKLLGVPPGNYDGYVERSQFWHVEYLGEDIVDYYPRVWAGRRGTIRVYFVKDSKGITSRDFYFYHSEPSTWFARMAQNVLGSLQEANDGW